MAIINEERIAQLKKENDAKLEVINNQFEMWLNGIHERVSAILNAAKDVVCTYIYFANNNLNADLFKIEEFSGGISSWSEYARSKYHIRCKISDGWEARLYVDSGKIQIERHISGMIDDTVFPFDIITLKRKPAVRNLIEEAVLNFEIYCKIVIERLNNL